MHLNVKSIFYMTIDGYKSCRKLRKQVFNTELNICYKNTKYSSMILMVAVAKWLADFPLDSYIPGSSSARRNFIFQKISWLKGHWNVPAIQSTEWWLNGGWNATEIHISRHHSVAIQPPFSHHSVDRKKCRHLVIVAPSCFHYRSHIYRHRNIILCCGHKPQRCNAVIVNCMTPSFFIGR